MSDFMSIAPFLSREPGERWPGRAEIHDRPRFADTNLLVYAFDRTEPEKQVQAREWLDTLWTTRTGRVSCQVLVEFYAVCARKLIADTGIARNLITGLLEWEPATPGPQQMREEWALQDRYGVSWWDALVGGLGQRTAVRLSANRRPPGRGQL